MISRAFDAAYPPASTPPGCEVAMGYVGREGFTPHVWTTGEWDRFAALPQLPIWVPDLAADPAAEAEEAVKAVEKIGWASHQVAERVIIFDVETQTGLRAWWQTIAREVYAMGFAPVMYGSLSTVLSNAAADLLVADWNDSPQLLPGQTIHGHQYQAGVQFGGTQLDFSVIDEWLFARAGLGPRHE